jgi:predicted acylesterase/phospholipase RssA
VHKKQRIGFCITGGGSRISQQFAMCEYLIREKGKIPDVFAGSSAGGLISVGVDAILAGRWSWDLFKQALFTVKNKEIYRKRWFIELAWLALWKRLPSWYDTAAERKLLRSWLAEIGIDKVGDLSRPCYICGVENETGYDQCWTNAEQLHRNLKLEDVLMATSAIPFEFNPQHVPHSSGPWFVDGATGRNYSPLEPLFTHPLDEIWIMTPAASKNKPKVDSRWIVDNTWAAVDYLLMDIFAIEIDYYPRLDKHTDYYVIKPLFDKFYPTRDFEQGKEQYDDTMAWLKKNFSQIKPQPKDWPPVKTKARPGIGKIIRMIEARKRKAARESGKSR